MKKLLCISLVLLVSVLMLAVPSTQAVEYGGIGGRPANPRPDNPRTKSIFIYTLKAGQTADDGIRIYNNTSETHTINVYAVDAALASGGAFTCAQKAEKPTDVGAWITLDSNNVTLEPNTNTVIPFHVAAPAKVDVGEHNGCIAIQDASSTAPVDGQSGVVLGFRSALRVAVTVPGKIVKKLSLDSVNIKQQDKGKLLITPTVTNTGNVSLDTSLTTHISPLIGTSQAIVNRGTYPVLPDSTASWNFENDRPFWGGWYRAAVTATYNNNPNATLGTRDTSPEHISRTSSVIFVAPKPLALLAELAILAIIAGAIFWLVRQSRGRHHVRHYWRIYEVKDGDTLSHIASRVGVSWKSIARANKLKAPYNLHAGQRLKVPPKKEQ
jgi:hypothetical protein